MHKNPVQGCVSVNYFMAPNNNKIVQMKANECLSEILRTNPAIPKPKLS